MTELRAQNNWEKRCWSQITRSCSVTTRWPSWSHTELTGLSSVPSSRTSSFTSIFIKPDFAPFLQDIQPEERQGILEYLYLGETIVSQNKICDLLAAAKDLKISELTGSNVYEEEASEEEDQVDQQEIISRNRRLCFSWDELWKLWQSGVENMLKCLWIFL